MKKQTTESFAVESGGSETMKSPMICVFSVSDSTSGRLHYWQMAAVPGLHAAGE